MGENAPQNFIEGVQLFKPDMLISTGEKLRLKGKRKVDKGPTK